MLYAAFANDDHQALEMLRHRHANRDPDGGHLALIYTKHLIDKKDRLRRAIGSLVSAHRHGAIALLPQVFDSEPEDIARWVEDTAKSMVAKTGGPATTEVSSQRNVYLV